MTKNVTYNMVVGDVKGLIFLSNMVDIKLDAGGYVDDGTVAVNGTSVTVNTSNYHDPSDSDCFRLTIKAISVGKSVIEVTGFYIPQHRLAGSAIITCIVSAPPPPPPPPIPTLTIVIVPANAN